MIAFPGARAAAIQLMRDKNPDDQINSDEDDDEEEDNELRRFCVGGHYQLPGPYSGKSQEAGKKQMLNQGLPYFRGPRGSGGGGFPIRP